jgi:hypothetical protein
VLPPAPPPPPQQLLRPPPPSPDIYPIIPAGGATIYSTSGAPTAGNSMFINSMDPIYDIATDTISLGDTVKAAAADSFNAKVIDLQHYMKLTRGFTI